MLEHTIRVHKCKTIYLNLSLVTCIFYVLSTYTVNIKLSNFALLTLENDDMESSKRCVKLLSLIFIIRYLTKSNLIPILKREDKLHFFRRLEDCSKKQVKCDGAPSFFIFVRISS